MKKSFNGNVYNCAKDKIICSKSEFARGRNFTKKKLIGVYHQLIHLTLREITSSEHKNISEIIENMKEKVIENWDENTLKFGLIPKRDKDVTNRNDFGILIDNNHPLKHP